MSKVNTGQASSTLIPKYIGSDFDKVVAVADNIEQVVECGPGKVLAGLIKRIDRSLNVISVCHATGVEQLINQDNILV